ncbi:MAG: tetratricopeptide repeat protein [Akkermansiaceae bacterium]|jgi:tetratricopeptide (TPR) repeat protein
MKYRALFLCLALPALGQETPPPVGEQNPLVAKPSRDIFDFATLIYNTAAGEKDPEKKKDGFRQAAKKFDAFLRAYPQDEKSLDSWYFLGLCYRQIGEEKASRQCFEAAATSWTEGKFVEASALYLASDDYGAEKWSSAAKWFAVTAEVTQDKKIRQESLYRRFLSYSKLNDSSGTLLALKEVLKDEDSPFAETARLALARLYRRSKVIRDAHDQYVLLSTSSKKEVRSEAILQAALTADELKDPKLAKIWFAKALKEDGLKEYHGQTQLALMNLHYLSTEWADVVKTFNDGNHPLTEENDLQRLIMAAKSYEALGKDDEVLKLYARISTLSPGSATSFQAAYRILVQEHGKNSRSFPRTAETFLTNYGTEYAQDTKVQSARLLIAEHYYGEKNYKRAIELYRDLDLALIDSSNRLGVRYHVAKSQLALKDEGGSLAAIAAFIKEYPNAQQSTQLRLDRAELLTSKGKETEAIADYHAVLAATADPELKRIILVRLSALYQEKKDWVKFVSTQEKLLLLPDLDTKTIASVNFWLGWNEFRLKKVESALPFLSKARELDAKTFAPKVGPLLIRAAYQAEDTVLLEQEIAIMRAADPKAPVPAAMLTWLGATLSREGHHDRAWPLLDEGLKDRSKPISNLIWKLFTQSSLAAGKSSSVVQAADEILATESHPYRKAEALYLKSQGLNSLKKFNEARQAASDALDLRPQGELDIQLRLHAGDIDMAEKKPGDAIRHYAVVETLYAKTPVDQALARAKVAAALKAIGTPEALEKLKKYQ